MTNKPTLGGYLELLIKVFATMIALIFWGVFIAAVAMAIPFLLSLICVLALAAAGAFIFSWEYVWVGMIFFLILIGSDRYGNRLIFRRYYYGKKRRTYIS